MSDNLGPNQTRVLDLTNRSFESVVYQRKKPPLSCEVNLTGSLASSHAQDLSKFMAPSGWDIVGAIKENTAINSCSCGDVFTSSTLSANSFKLVATEQGALTRGLVALVNGWELHVQGTNSGDDNNLITLPVPPSITYRVDFVFLEVWRKLVTPTDTVYAFGNVLYGGTNPANDLIDPAVNIETTKRIQTQYRIRVVAGVDIINNPDGFDPVQVFVQGPLAAPISYCNQAYFVPVPGDMGLWRAGDGSSATQETLGTVDGYTYAIPMFAIGRRNTSSYSPSTFSNGAGRTLANYLAGLSSDRPDGKYSDWIVPEDILDLRHLIATSMDTKKLATSAFQRLLKGQYRSKMEASFKGEDYVNSVLVQADSIGSVSWADQIGGTGTTPDGVRRVYSNAGATQHYVYKVFTVNDKVVGTPGVAWDYNDQVEISCTSPVYPSGTTISMITVVSDPNPPYSSYSCVIYDPTALGGMIADNVVVLTALPANIVRVQIGGSVLQPTSTNSFLMCYTLSIPVGANGFTYLPDKVLEFREVTGLTASSFPIAAQGNDLRIHAGPDSSTVVGSSYNVLSNYGASLNEPYNFGHQMVYHIDGEGILRSSVTFSRVLGKLVSGGSNGYNILGIASILVDGVLTTPSSISRTATDYIVNFLPPISGNDIQFNLYTETKFFATNIQGRGIIETYEMKEYTPIPTIDPLVYYVDAGTSTVPQQIIAMASNAWSDGTGYVYDVGDSGKQVPTLVNNSRLPSSEFWWFTPPETGSRLNITFSIAPIGPIEVSLLTLSAVKTSEKYAIFYNRTPYQGLLDSSATGVVMGEGNAITTTAGSGAITDYVVDSDAVTYYHSLNLTANGTLITSVGTFWYGNVHIGDTITFVDSLGTRDYVVSDVLSNTSLIVSEAVSLYSLTAYAITRPGVPSFAGANAIDRLPIYTSTCDSSGMSDNISVGYMLSKPLLETRIIERTQDILDLPVNVINVGENTTALDGRGRARISMPAEFGPLGQNNLGLVFETLDDYGTGVYQKTYQSYIFNKDVTRDGTSYGQVPYLMVVSSDASSDIRKFDPTSNLDTVDLFELPGRPLTARENS